MEQRKDKQPIEVNVFRVGGSLVFAIPEQIQNHSNISEGDTLKIQTEYSDTYGPYNAFWNPEQQGDEE